MFPADILCGHRNHRKVFREYVPEEIWTYTRGHTADIGALLVNMADMLRRDVGFLVGDD